MLFLKAVATVMALKKASGLHLKLSLKLTDFDMFSMTPICHIDRTCGGGGRSAPELHEAAFGECLEIVRNMGARILMEAS